MMDELLRMANELIEAREKARREYEYWPDAWPEGFMPTDKVAIFVDLAANHAVDIIKGYQNLLLHVLSLCAGGMHDDIQYIAERWDWLIGKIEKSLPSEEQTVDLEYQLSNGMWHPASPEHLDWYLDGAIEIERTIAHNLGRPVAFDTREGAMEQLADGETLKYGEDWYDSIRRVRPPVVRKPDTRSRVTCKICGQTGYDGDVPFTTLPTSQRTCDDCI